MWRRRRFLETVSTLPFVGGVLGALSPSVAESAVARGGRDYFRELGVRPFINAAGTYTAMTASLMPPEVMEAIQYASGHFVMLDELHDRVGERIASLLRSEAAMVTAGAASALTLGTAGVLTGTDRKKVGALPILTDMKSDVIIQKSHRFGYDHAVRACGVTLVEVESSDELERAITPRTAMLLFFNGNNNLGADQGRGLRATGEEARHPDDERLRRGRAAGRELLEVHGDGLRPRGLLGRQGHSRPAERGPAPRAQGPHRRGAPQRPAERVDWPRHEGEQGGDAGHARRPRVLPEAHPRARHACSRNAPRSSARARAR